MGVRIGTILISIKGATEISGFLNELIGDFHHIILARLGVPSRQLNGISLISLIVEGSNDEIGALTGKLGKISGVEVKSVLLSNKKE